MWKIEDNSFGLELSTGEVVENMASQGEFWHFPHLLFFKNVTQGMPISSTIWSYSENCQKNIKL